MSRISRSPGRNTRMSPGPSRDQLLTGVDDRLGLVADDGLALVVVVGLLDQRPVAHLDRVGPAGHLDDRRRRAVRLREVGREPLRVDRGRGDHDLEVGALRQQLLEVAEDEVDVEAALVRLVDDQGVVRREQPVVLELGQQDAVGHQLDQRVLAGPVGEPHLVADGAARLTETRAASSSAIRSATLRAAIRRGWVCPIIPCTPRPSSRQIFGSWVVLPEPVSPATTTTWWSRIAAAMSSRRWLTGSSSGSGSPAPAPGAPPPARG